MNILTCDLQRNTEGVTSPYNPVVHETTKDFKPTNIQTKIVQV
jgi:hypothetical protein